MCTFQGHLFWNCGDQWPSQKCFNHLKIRCIFQYRSMCCCCKAMTFTTWNTNSQQKQTTGVVTNPKQQNRTKIMHVSKRRNNMSKHRNLTQKVITHFFFFAFCLGFFFAWAHLPCQDIISQQLFETGCKNDTNFLALDLFSMVGAEQQGDNLRWDHWASEFVNACHVYPLL